MLTIVRGIVALHPAQGSGAFERMRAAAPISLGPAEGVHIEVLNWRAVAAAVHPRRSTTRRRRRRRSRICRRPRRSCCAHISEVVGVQPAGLLQRRRRPSTGRARWCRAGSSPTNLGPKQPCADGEHRMRTRGCEHVVIVYRDRAEYAEGRARWAAYQAEVLEADLSKGLGLRRTIAVPDTGFLSKRRPRRRLRRAPAPRPLGRIGARRNCRRTATVGRRFEPLERPRRHAVGAAPRRGRACGAAAAAVFRRRPVRRPPDAARARLGPRRARRDPDRRAASWRIAVRDRRRGRRARPRSSPTRSRAACPASRSASPRPSATTTRCSSQRVRRHRRAGASRRPARPAPSRSRSAATRVQRQPPGLLADARQRLVDRPLRGAGGPGRVAVHGHGLRRARRHARPAGDRHRDRGDRRRRARDPGRDRAVVWGVIGKRVPV